MVRYALATSSWDDRERAALHAVIESDQHTMGPQVAEYERQFAAHFGSRHAVMVSSGSAANLLMIAASFYTREPLLRRGDEIIVPAVSWSTTYFPLQQYGLRVKFVDIDRRTLNMDVEKLAAAVTDRTRAVLLVNLLGNPNDMEAVRSVVGDRDILLLEDNCESMGAVFGGRPTGTFGAMGTFSSFFSHHISTMEGGCVLTDSTELYHVMLSLRAHGWTRNLPAENAVTGQKSADPFEESFKFVLPGYNLRPLEMSGAVGQVQLQKLDGFVSARRRNAACFRSLLGDHPYLDIQQEVGESSWFGFSLVLREDAPLSRAELVRHLTDASIEVRPIVTGNFLKNENVLRFFDYEVGSSVENAEYVDVNGLFVGNSQEDLTAELHHLRDTVRLATGA